MRVHEYAKKTFLAMDNRYHSVKRVYPNSIDYISEKDGYYLGTKEVNTISEEFVKSLENIGFYHHTIDKASHSGRAIDLDLINPLTGGYMTGSSSGTALNVFLGINDLGIGTDGGGSVLAPAMSLNLFGFIHPDLGQAEKQGDEVKISTDGIAFTPSIGLIAKDLEMIEKVIIDSLNLSDQALSESFSIGVDKSDDEIIEVAKQKNLNFHKISLDGKFSKTRSELISELSGYLDEFDFLISSEGPVDLHGFGDTVFGHFSDETAKIQKAANKGFLRVANMVNAASIVIPTSELSKGYVLITKAKDKNIQQLLTLAQVFSSERDELTDRYFGNMGMYFENGI